MAQYIDKSALVAEIERRRRDWRFGSSTEAKFKREECDDILSFLNTLEVKDDMDTIHPIEDVVSNDTLSNDLEEAARKVGQKYFPNENNIWARPNYEAKKAENAFKEGAQWQKEKIMKDAIEREVKEDAGGYPYIDATELYDYDNDKPLAKEGDKVNVIIMTRE